MNILLLLVLIIVLIPLYYLIIGVHLMNFISIFFKVLAKSFSAMLNVASAAERYSKALDNVADTHCQIIEQDYQRKLAIKLDKAKQKTNDDLEKEIQF